jgi:lipopolysaccharide heptosyltransferase III
MSSRRADRVDTTRGSALLKSVDRYAGVALLAPFALQPKRADIRHEAPRRIGLLKTAAIGDTFLLAGLLGDLRRAHPRATIVFITGADNEGAARLLPDRADEHLVVSPRDPIAAVRRIRRAKLDVIVDLGAWPRFDALLATLSGARLRVGFNTTNQHRHFGFDRTVAHSAAVHERENYVRLLSAIGVEARSAPQIPPPRVLGEYPPAPYAVFHAWSSGYMHHVKEWPTDRWVGLAAAVATRGWTIVLSGGRAERPRTAQLATALRSTGVDVIDAAGCFSLPELADLLSKSQAVVSVNTGVMHLAALVGARTVSLEGPTPPRRWGPLGPRTRSVVSTHHGSGYLNLGFEYSGQRHDCMEGVAVDAVLRAIDELLDTDTLALHDGRDGDQASEN